MCWCENGSVSETVAQRANAAFRFAFNNVSSKRSVRMLTTSFFCFLVSNNRCVFVLYDAIVFLVCFVGRRFSFVVRWGAFVESEGD